MNGKSNWSSMENESGHKTRASICEWKSWVVNATINQWICACQSYSIARTIRKNNSMSLEERVVSVACWVFSLKYGDSDYKSVPNYASCCTKTRNEISSSHSDTFLYIFPRSRILEHFLQIWIGDSLTFGSILPKYCMISHIVHVESAYCLVMRRTQFIFTSFHIPTVSDSQSLHIGGQTINISRMAWIIGEKMFQLLIHRKEMMLIIIHDHVVDNINWI